MHRSKTRWLIAAGVLWLLLWLSACQPQQRYQQSFLQFGTLIDITLVSASEARAQQTFERIETLLKQRHRQWHGWQDGELKRLNDALASGKTVEIPPVLRELIIDSKKYYRLTGERFNPALGKLIAAWGFHASSKPDLALIQTIQHKLPGMNDLIIEGNQARSTNRHLQLDFGAIAKGLAIRQIATLIRQQGINRFIINAGGDIYADAGSGQPGWRIAIENPFFAQGHARVIGGITLQHPTSIFTSGNYRRFVVDENGQKRHHIIDPKTGAPSRSISAVTVISDDPVLADVAATTLMLTPLPELAAMAKALGIADYLIITEQHEAWLSVTMNERIEWIENSALTPHIIKTSGEQPNKLAE